MSQKIQKTSAPEGGGLPNRLIRAHKGLTETEAASMGPAKACVKSSEYIL